MSPNVSHKQLEELLSFMEAHPDLAKGLLRDLEGRKKMQTSWKDITTKLNDMGPQKTTKQWQKVWADKKYSARKAIFVAKKSVAETLASTGGLSTAIAAPIPSETDLRVLDLVGGFDKVGATLNSEPGASTTAEVAGAGGSVSTRLTEPSTSGRSRSRSPVHPQQGKPREQDIVTAEFGDTESQDREKVNTGTCRHAMRLVQLEEQRMRNEMMELEELQKISAAIEKIPGEMSKIRESLEVLLDVGRELAINFFESNVKN